MISKKKIERMNNLSLNELNGIAIARNIKLRRYVEGRFINCSFKI